MIQKVAPLDQALERAKDFPSSHVQVIISSFASSFDFGQQRPARQRAKACTGPLATGRSGHQVRAAPDKQEKGSRIRKPESCVSRSPSLDG